MVEFVHGLRRKINKVPPQKPLNRVPGREQHRRRRAQDTLEGVLPVPHEEALEAVRVNALTPGISLSRRPCTERGDFVARHHHSMPATTSVDVKRDAPATNKTGLASIDALADYIQSLMLHIRPGLKRRHSSLVPLLHSMSS